MCMHLQTVRALAKTAAQPNSCTSLDHEPRTIAVAAFNDNSDGLELLQATLTHTLLRAKAVTACL
jgi:hypothetical protein